MPRLRAPFLCLAFVRLLPRGKILPALVAVFLAALAPARAQVITAVASGDWADGATWAGGVVPGAGNTASLSAVTLMLGSNATVGGLTGDAGSTLSLASGVTLTTGDNNTSTTFAGILSGAGGLTKTGAGTLTLSGANTYTGATTINSGTLILAGLRGAKDVSLTGTTAVLEVITSLSGPFGLPFGSLSGVAGSNVSLSSGSRISVGANNTNTTFDGNITGGGSPSPYASLYKDGAGTLTLSGTNTYLGWTAVRFGTLALVGGEAIPDTSEVNVYPVGSLDIHTNETIRTLGGSGMVTLNGGVTLTLAGNSTLGPFSAFSGVITGEGALTKTSTGSLNLSGANTYTGATTIASGSLIISGGAAISDSADVILSGVGARLFVSTSETLGSLAGVAGSAVTLVTGVVLTLGANNASTAYAGVIHGGDSTSGLVKVGTGTFTLARANTYSGTTTISAGTLAYGVGNALPAAAKLTVAADGILDLGTFSGSVSTLTNTGHVILGNGATLAVTTLSNGGNITLGTGAVLTTGGSNGSGTFGGVLTGAGSLIKTGTGTLTLSGATSHTGTTTISAGTVVLTGGVAIADTGAVALAASSVTLSVLASETIGSLAGGAGSTVTLASGVMLTTGGDNTSTTFSGVLVASGALTKIGTGTLTLTNTNNYIGGTTLGGGTVVLASPNPLGFTGAIIFSGGTLQFSASNTTDFSNRFSSAAGQAYRIDTNGQGVTFASALTSAGGSLTKLGGGTLTLSGPNTYTGTTTVSAGTLALASTRSNNIAASATISIGATGNLNVTGLSQGTLVLANNQTLAGSGTVSGKITATSGLAHLSPSGSAVGTLTIGSLVLSNHLVLDLDFANLTTYDTINVTELGGLSLLGARFNLLNAGTATPFTGLGTFALITFAGSLSDPNSLLATLTASSVLNAAAGRTYTFSVSGNTLLLTNDTLLHQWQTDHFGSTVALAAQPAADPDHDGVPNLLEYALGTNPLAASTTSLPVPAIAINPADGLPHLTLTASLAAAAGDVSVDAEVSDDLVNWQAGALFIEVVSDTTTGAVRTLVIRDTTPLGAGAKRFMRLRVTLP